MTITELAREAREYQKAYRFWFMVCRRGRRAGVCPLYSRGLTEEEAMFLAFRGRVVAPVQNYSGRLRQRVEDTLPVYPSPWRFRWRKEITKSHRDEWRQAMRGER